MDAVLLCVLVIVLSIALIAVAISREMARQRKNRIWLDFYKIENRAQDALDSTSLKKVRNAIQSVDQAHSIAAPYLDRVSEHIYRVDRADLVEHACEIEEDLWLRKAEPHLVRFSDAWDELMRDVENPFRDAEYLLGLSRKCVSAWQSYFAVDLDQFSVTIYPKRYMREFMGEDYDPCMESSDALRKKLDERVNWLRPEAARKRKLYRLIVDYVEQRGTVPRSELLKTPFDGYIPEEVRACYRDLLAKNRLVAVQIGKPYFVSLSDKEVERRAKQREKKTSRE